MTLGISIHQGCCLLKHGGHLKLRKILFQFERWTRECAMLYKVCWMRVKMSWFWLFLWMILFFWNNTFMGVYCFFIGIKCGWLCYIIWKLSGTLPTSHRHLLHHHMPIRIPWSLQLTLRICPAVRNPRLVGKNSRDRSERRVYPK